MQPWRSPAKWTFRWTRAGQEALRTATLPAPTAPTLDGLGAVGDGAHAKHEFAYIHVTVQRCAMLALLLLVLLES
jgi:hypothetical protein